jgi:hypothetical protein
LKDTHVSNVPLIENRRYGRCLVSDI